MPESEVPPFEELRRILFATAYKMTGEVAPSEDLVQEVVLPFQLASEKRDPIQNLRAYLIRSIINASLNYLKCKEQERAAYKGPWLPEPIQGIDKNWDNQLDMEYGLTVLMARLAPRERAVFLLREAFSFSHTDIAECLGETHENIRKRYQRAKARMGARRRLNPVEQAEKEALLQAFSDTIMSGNFEPLIARLKEDIVLYSDGGGKVAAAINPIVGIETCLKFLFGIFQKKQGKVQFKPTRINGEPAVLVVETGEMRPTTVIVFDLVGEQIENLYLIRNPDKINFFVPKSS